MGIQNKLAEVFAPLQRKLFDYQIDLIGSDVKVIRLKIVENDYEDETITVISNDTITLKLDLPTEIPLYWLRGTAQDALDEKTGLYLYDILPIEGYSSFEDNVERFDVFIKKIKDNNSSTDPMLMILRVTEPVGSFNVDELVWKKFYCAPYNMTISTEIQTIIDAYEAE